MNKKNLYVILGIIVIVLIGLFVFLQSQKEKTAVTPQGQQVGVTIPEKTPEEIDQELMRKAIDTQDASFCNEMKIVADKNACLTNVIAASANVKRDASICNQLDDQYQRLVCKDNVIFNKAGDNKDVVLCEQMADKTRIKSCQDYVNSLIK